MALSGTLEDCEEIRQLYARYCHSIDNRQYEKWVDCFTDDGVFESPRFGRYAGRDGLRRFTEIYREALGGVRVRHVSSTVGFEISGEQAAGLCYFAYFQCKGGKAELAAVGHYDDTLRKENGVWKFESRRVTVDGGGR